MISVLVVDDSAFYRVSISSLLNSTEEMHVIGTAKDGPSAVRMAGKLMPDVVTIDFELAGMDGIEVIKEIKRTIDRPVIIFSAFKGVGSDVALSSLEEGAFDFVEKPRDFNSSALQGKKEEIISKIKAAHKFSSSKKIFQRKEKKDFLLGPRSTTEKIILIASSTGGPQTLEQFITDIPSGIPYPILIVQHMPPVFTKSFADRLNNMSNVTVVEAEEGDVISPGTVYIAPGDFHMVLSEKREAGRIRYAISLNKAPQEQGVRPCANILFKSVAPLFKDQTIAIVLTGMGKDGTEGAREIKKYHGSVIAQSEKTCIIYGMPKSIVDENLADEVVDLGNMVVALLQLVEA